VRLIGNFVTSINKVYVRSRLEDLHVPVESLRLYVYVKRLAMGIYRYTTMGYLYNLYRMFIGFDFIKKNKLYP